MNEQRKKLPQETSIWKEDEQMKKQALVRNKHWKEDGLARRETTAKKYALKKKTNIWGKKHKISIEKKMNERAALLHTLGLT